MARRRYTLQISNATLQGRLHQHLGVERDQVEAQLLIRSPGEPGKRENRCDRGAPFAYFSRVAIHSAAGNWHPFKSGRRANLVLR